MKAAMFFGKMCNANCSYCCNKWYENDRNTRMSKEQLMFAAKTLCLFPESLETIMYCGGEPTVIADDLVEQMRALPRSKSLKLFSNGLLLPELKLLTKTAAMVTDSLELRISVHDCLYADNRKMLDEHFAAWAELHTYGNVRYVVMLDGARTLDYIDLLNYVVDVVGSKRVNCTHARRGSSDVNMVDLARSMSVVKRFGNTGLQSAAKITLNRDMHKNPNMNKECSGNRHVIAFNEQNIRGVLCSSLSIPYDNPYSVVEKIINAPPLYCDSRFFFCECSLDW